MSKADDVYFESIRRKDKRYNFCIVPLSSLNEPEYVANGLKQDAVIIDAVFINDKPLKIYNLNGPLFLSLKPGKYKIKINFKVNTSLSTTMYSIVRKRKNEEIDDNSYHQKLKYSGSKETMVTIGELGDYYALFKTRVVSTWICRGSEWKVWSLKETKYGNEFYQSDLRTISSLCSYWEGYKKHYNYPPIDLNDLFDVWANS